MPSSNDRAERPKWLQNSLRVLVIVVLIFGTVAFWTPIVMKRISSAGGGVWTTGPQTLPSAYYLQDDVQYFPAGTEFNMSSELDRSNRIDSTD